MEINLFTMGDSRDVNLWSGFPYFFSNALERNGVILNRINVFPDSLVRDLYGKVFGHWARLSRAVFQRDTSRDFYRSRILMYFVTQKANAGCAQFPHADYNLFMGPDAPVYKFSTIPTLFYLDQSFAQAFARQRKTTLTAIERLYLEVQNENFRRAKWVFCTYPEAVEFLRAHYGGANVYPRNLIGINLDLDTVSIARAVERKRDSRSILFISRNAYGRGADILVDAFRLLRARRKGDCRLYVVGASRDALGLRDEADIVCYEYLDQSKPNEKRVYRNLLESARVFAIPYRDSSLLASGMFEAMAAGTPVIVSNVDTVREYVRNMENGILLEENTPEACAHALDLLFQDTELWERLARNAHASMQKYSWDQVAREMLAVLYPECFG